MFHNKIISHLNLIDTKMLCWNILYTMQNYIKPSEPTSKQCIIRLN